MLTDQQIDEFLEMLAKSPTSARDMVRGLFAANEAKAEPFGYFRAEPMGWTDCAADDEGAIALYERPAAPAVPQGWRKQRMANWPHSEHGMRLIGFVVPDDGRPLGLISERLEEIIGSVTPATPAAAAPSQPVTLTDEEIEELQWRVPAARNSTADEIQIRTTRQMTLFARAIIAALREKEAQP